MTAPALLVLAAWLYLLLGHGGFWRARETDAVVPAGPDRWPAVTAIVPARDEAAVIARVVAALVAQDYPGAFRVLLVDDASTDGTARIARDAAGARAGMLDIVAGGPTPAGWTGKLWAMAQGTTAAGDTARWLWFTDADIVHAPDTLRSLVARAEADGLVLHSLMAELRCMSLAERALVPAFIFFFRMLYPFARVNGPGRTAAAAGGCMLVERAALARAGGLARIRHALIDDCAMGALMKAQGRVRLALTHRALSIRPYPHFGDIGAMIARSAYAQLRYSPLLLAGTLAGLALLYLAPPLLALAGTGTPRLAGAAAWLLMALAFQPTLRFYRRLPLWGLALPAIAAFYAGCTCASALAHRRGRGGMWKGRAQAGLAR